MVTDTNNVNVKRFNRSIAVSTHEYLNCFRWGFTGKMNLTAFPSRLNVSASKSFKNVHNMGINMDQDRERFIYIFMCVCVCMYVCAISKFY